MEDYLEQFQPKPLAPHKKELLLGPALELLKEEQMVPVKQSLFWSRTLKFALAASLLFLFGVNSYLTHWNQKIMQRYGQEFTQANSNAIENILSETEKNGIQHYFFFQKLSQHQQKTKNITRHYESLNKW